MLEVAPKRTLPKKDAKRTLFCCPVPGAVYLGDVQENNNANEVARLVRQGRVATFDTLSAAHRFADRTHKPTSVLMGDEDLYYVAGLRDAAVLHRAGYDYVSH